MAIRSVEMLTALLSGYGLTTGDELTSGNVFYVDSGCSGGLDKNGYGLSWEMPFLTLDFALSQCVASQGDVIYLAPGHAETIATATDLLIDVIGVTIIGLGHGTLRPTFTVGATGVAGCDVNIDAANVTIKNCIFVVAAVDVLIMIDVNAKGFHMKDCFIDAAITLYQAVTAIDITGAEDNSCDGAHIENCTITALTAGADEGIELGEIADQVVIEGCTILGDFVNAAIHNITGKVLTNLIVKDCILQNTQTGDHAMELVSACTGMLIRNMMYGSDDALILDPGACWCFENYGIDAINEGAYLRPAVGTP